MVIVPRERPLMNGLNSWYCDIPKLLEHSQPAARPPSEALQAGLKRAVIHCLAEIAEESAMAAPCQDLPAKWRDTHAEGIAGLGLHDRK
jgi:hypothetical protein